MPLSSIVDKSNDFWRYSLLLYSRPGVAKACIALQDRHGLDVNVMLFAMWAGSRGRTLHDREIDVLLAACATWQELVVKPLRATRREEKRKGNWSVVYLRGIAEMELAAERVQQDSMFSLLRVGAGPCDHLVAADNLHRYVALSVQILANVDTQDLSCIWHADYPNAVFDFASASGRQAL